jgi:hypothetical protein
MKNPADLFEVCKEIIKYVDNGDPAKDVLEQTPYSESDLIYELALAYISAHEIKSQFRTVTNGEQRDGR